MVTDLVSSWLFHLFPGHQFGLDSQQSARLDEMLNDDEPQVDNDDDPQIFACFSDEEFTGPDEVDEW